MMSSTDDEPTRSPASERAPDDESTGWVRTLGANGPEREAAVVRLHALLLAVAWAETGRRSGQHGLRGPELDDLACQAADDAVMSILRKITEFRVTAGSPPGRTSS